ncbi:MAG: sugar ABC transporter ATP-binding protein, partial [Rhizobiaceae bacterium]|nr:sugar ABC transporter ATP-binding protein [Rhizobiaceae bacterium]
GEIRVSGQPCHFSSPRDSWAAGIAAIHQETVMFDELSVAENIFMGHMPIGSTHLVDWSEMRAKAKELLDRIDAEIPVDFKLKRLSVAQKHLVEIARALSHDAQVVIMDEPTAALSANEIDDLFRIVEQLKSEGHAIVFISHKFDEIFRIADDFVCLRDGEKVGEGEIAATTEAELVRMMVGRPVDQVFPKRDVPIGDVILSVKDLSNATEYADISFDLRKGEILGLYGLVGAGRTEAMQGLFGITPVTHGTVTLEGRPLKVGAPSDAIASGISYVPEDRQ